MVKSWRHASTYSRMACSGLTRLTPTRLEIGSHHAPRPSITRDAASGSPLICLPSSHMVLHDGGDDGRVARPDRQHAGADAQPSEVRVRKADIMTTQSRARRVSACQISLKPRDSAYSAISSS